MIKKLLKAAMGFYGKKGSGKPPGQPKEKHPLSVDYAGNLKQLRQIFDLCSDFVIREFVITAQKPLKVFIVYLEGLSDPALVTEHVMKSILTISFNLKSEVQIDKSNAQRLILERLLTISDTTTANDFSDVANYVLAGNIALVAEGSDNAIIASVQSLAGLRSVNEPDTEPVVRGPREGFVEGLSINLSLLRRRIKTSRLKTETFELGVLTKTRVVVCYIKGIANQKIVEEVKSRVGRINTDNVSSSSMIEENIIDEALTLFPLVQYTERPDKTAAALFEGKVAIVVDNTPMVLIAPCTFNSLLQAAEDYYNNPIFATFIRLVRFVGLNIALLLPAVVVAIFSFHQEMLPTPLLSTIERARQNLPFPIFVEVMFMELTFELLREAGVRLPKTIGQAVSTVGGLVIGQAAVNAGFIAPIPVIVVALTAIASFTIPNYAAGTAIRILRFGLIILAAIMGGVGIMFGLMAILVHLCSLRSFGVPYLSPFAPLSPTDWKDTVVRVPWWAMLTRPRLYGDQEPVRQDVDQGPLKPDQGGEQS